MWGSRRQDHSFAHGIHPPEAKDDTRDLPIKQFPFAPVMIVPLSQHMGAPAQAVVREGQEVQRGQLIAEPDGFMSVAMHAPASGTVQRLGLAPSINGKMVPAVYLKPFPGSSQEVGAGQPCDLDKASPDDILAAIQWAGIVGLGGAAFPTHVKLKIPDDKSIDTLVINGVECEPYLTTDHRVMMEQQADIFMGIRYLMKVTGAERTIIGVEGNKLDVAESLREHLPPGEPVDVEVVEVKYPQGAEKMLITALLDREVPSGGLPSDVNVVVVNVATTAEIGRLLPTGRGIQERVITIGGPGIRKKGNYRIPIGTPLRFALEYAGMEEELARVFLGGPMMGQALPSLDIPITKGTSGFIAFSTPQTAGAREFPCIHCGYCMDACPLFLNPSQLGLLAKKGRYEDMAEQYNLMDCFECGSCSYVCPAHIPLVQRFRGAKTMLRKQKATS
jgi:electron transport complex protein RnfC